MDPTNSNPALGTNAPAPEVSATAATHLPLWLQHDWLQLLLVALITPGLYYMLVMLGRRLKRKHGVRLGVLYHAFSLGFAVFLPAVLLRPDWSIVPHIGAL